MTTDPPQETEDAPGSVSVAERTVRRVVCAAVRAEDGEVMLGVRHYSRDMHRQIECRIDGNKFMWRHNADQGFVDQYGIFMSREEAYQVAQNAGQLVCQAACSSGRDGPRLHSEALY